MQKTTRALQSLLENSNKEMCGGHYSTNAGLVVATLFSILWVLHKCSKPGIRIVITETGPDPETKENNQNGARP